MIQVIDSILESELSESDSLKLIQFLLSDGDEDLKIKIFKNFKERPIAFKELSVIRKYILDQAKKIDLGKELLDVCGTGGDGKNTFNISSLVAITLASIGIKVAKHGNYSASSIVGSSNIIESFGIKFTNETSVLEKNIKKFGLVFLHAPLFHPILKNIAPVRKSLGFRTFFNLMGPMANPANPEFQVNGVSSEEDQDLIAQILKSTGTKFYLVYDLNGYDEVSLTGKVRIVGDHEFFLEPADFGLKEIDGKLLEINSPEEAKEIFINVLSGKDSDKINVVAANASLALNLINGIPFNEGTELVKAKLKSGEAYKFFESLIG